MCMQEGQRFLQQSLSLKCALLCKLFSNGREMLSRASKYGVTRGRTLSRDTRVPVFRLMAILLAPVGSTPMTRMPGSMLFTRAAIPAAMPATKRLRSYKLHIRKSTSIRLDDDASASSMFCCVGPCGTVLGVGRTASANGYKNGMQVSPQIGWAVPKNLQPHCALQNHSR